MSQFYVQLPASELYPEDSIEFFDSLDAIEEYSRHLLENVFNGDADAEPLQQGFCIYQGVEYASAVVRLPTSGELFCFREPQFLDESLPF